MPTQPVFNGISFGLASNVSYVGTIYRPKFRGINFDIKSNPAHVGTIYRPKFRGINFDIKSNPAHVGTIYRPNLRGFSINSPLSILTLKVQDISGNVIQGASVRVTTTGGFDKTVVSNSYGLVIIPLIPLTINTLTIQNSGFQNYKYIWTPQSSTGYHWEQTLNKIVPFVVASPDNKVLVNLNVTDPENIFYSKT